MRHSELLLFLALTLPGTARADSVSVSGNALTIKSGGTEHTFFSSTDLETEHMFRVSIPLSKLKPAGPTGGLMAGVAVPMVVPAAVAAAPAEAKAPDPETAVSAIQKTPPPAEPRGHSYNEDDLLVDANSHYYEGRFREALHEVDKVLQTNSKSVRGWLMRGSLLHVMGNDALAAVAWQKALELDPQNAELQKFARPDGGAELRGHP